MESFLRDRTDFFKQVNRLFNHYFFVLPINTVIDMNCLTSSEEDVMRRLEFETSPITILISGRLEMMIHVNLQKYNKVLHLQILTSMSLVNL